MPFDGTTDPVVELLIQARALIAKPGHWCQDYSHAGRAYCALGAIRSLEKKRRRLLALERLMRALPHGYTSIVGYNDEPGRTQADIVGLYDRAIERTIGNTGNH